MPPGKIRFALILLLIVLTACKPCKSQLKGNNAFFTEIAAQGPVYSFNYDRIFSRGEKMAFSIRAGFSIVRKAIYFPAGVNLLSGLNKHHAEFSFAIIPVIEFVDKNSGSNNDGTDTYFYLNPAIGYRFQKPGKGIFFRTTAGPSVYLDPPAGDFWNMKPKLFLSGSIGIGYGF